MLQIISVKIELILIKLKPQIELVEENCGLLKEGTRVCADNGYCSGNSIHYLTDKKLDPYIQTKKRLLNQKQTELRIKDSVQVTMSRTKKMTSLYALKIKD